MAFSLPVRWPALAAAGLSLLVVALLYVAQSSPRPALAADPRPNAADVVVQFGDGAVVTRRITFTGTISGLAALRRAGLPLVEKNGAVCRVGATGCAADQDCFCACPPPFEPCLFWSYQRWNGRAWAPGDKGAGLTDVADGAVEGWTWGRALPRVSPPVLGAQAALLWLKPQQQPDGSYASDTGLTIDTLLAVAAGGGSPAEWRSGPGPSLLDYLRAQAGPYAGRNTRSAGKLALAVAAAGLDPRDFAGIDLVARINAGYNPDTGAYGGNTWDQAFAILGLRAAGETVPVTAAARLASRANSDGGWGFVRPGDSDVDTTALALQALIAAGTPRDAAVVMQALAYLDTVQAVDGGFPNTLATGGSDMSNANSTSFAVQAILAAGSDPLAARWRPAATNPISYLLALQQPDGAVTFGGQSSLLATQQAVPALVGRAFPYPSAAVALRRGLQYIGAQQQADGGFGGFGVGSTLDAIIAIRAAGGSPQSFVSSEGARPLDYLRPRAAAYAAGSAAASGKLMVGLVAAGADPRSFAGLNLVISTTLRYDRQTGAYGATTFDQSWSILGLATAGQTIPLSATQRLEAIQATGGGWGFDANADAADPDSTGLALQALAAAARPPGVVAIAAQVATQPCMAGAAAPGPAARAGLAYLRRAQRPDAGFPGFDGNTSASSTGLALQALAAFGESPRSLSWTTVISDGTASPLTQRNPLDTLLGLQTTQGGFPGFGGPNDITATYQALPGIAGKAFPYRGTLAYLPIAGR